MNTYYNKCPSRTTNFSIKVRCGLFPHSIR